MKIYVEEHADCFAIDLTAETLGEAALLTRMGVDSCKEIQWMNTTVQKAQGGNGNDPPTKDHFTFGVVLRRQKAANNYLPRRRR